MASLVLELEQALRVRTGKQVRCDLDDLDDYL